MRASAAILVAACLASAIGSGRAQNTYCWTEGECALKSEVQVVCVPRTNQSSCANSQHCVWQTEDSLLELRGDVPDEELAGLPWPAAFNLTLAARACGGDGAANETCPTACRDYLQRLGSRTVGQALTAVCALSTCNANGLCWDSEGQAKFKSMFRAIASTCLGQDFPSCWPSGGRCGVVDVCDGLDQDACNSATLEEGGRLVCNYTSWTRCDSVPSGSPHPSGEGGYQPGSGYQPSGSPPGDPCQDSADPCCRRADSFTACVLDSPPSDSCYFYSSGCQNDWGLCSQQLDSASCQQLSLAGCGWVDTSGSGGSGSWPSPPEGTQPWYPPSNGTGTGPNQPPLNNNGTGSGTGPSQPPPNNNGTGSSQPPPNFVPGAAPWEIWQVPELPSSYFANDTGDRWWHHPKRGGHGLFDVLTPPLASSLLEARASGPICQALTSLLRALPDGRQGVCDGACFSGSLSQVAGAMEEPLDFCDVCARLVEDFVPMLLNDTGIDAAGLLSGFEPGAFDAFGAVCPRMLDGVFWVAKHYDVLPGPAHPIAAAVCPALRAVVAAEPQLVTDTNSTCELLGSPPECVDVLGSLLSLYKGLEPAAAAQQLCYTLLPDVFDEGGRGHPDGGPPQQGGYPRDAAAQSAPPPAGYCTMGGNQPVCMAPDPASCSTIAGCRWSATCQRQQCGEQDYWCQQRSAALPICAPLVRAILPPGGGGAPAPLPEVCRAMGMCAGANSTSPGCTACKTAFAETVASTKCQRSHGQGNGYSYDARDSAFSQCSGTVLRMIAVKAQCDGYAGLNASSAASAASLCQARASVLCQATDSGTDCSLCTTLLSAYTELAGAGALAGPGALVELCYSVAQWDGGSADSLRQQLQWRFGCSPSESACCAPLPGDSFLAASLGIRGLTPQTTSNCEEQPGCTAGAYCWPSWGADTCQSLSGAAACQANRQCQWFAWSVDGEQGNCVDAALSATCRLAGVQGGRTGCQGIRDDQGLPQCSYFQACYQDWSLRQCDESNACCLTPAELFQPDAPDACANETSSAAVCDYTTQCQTRYDACNSYISQATCELSSSCAWRSMKPQGYPSYGWCSSTRDACWDYSGDAEACASAPSCRSVPRCDVSHCERGDACCLIHSADECAATGGCATTGWCSLATSDCWSAWSADTCAAAAGCSWQSYEYQAADGGTASGGWCSVAADPCSQHSGAPIACAAVRDPRRGTPVCRYQSSCYDACRTCRGCLSGVGDFARTVLPGLGGNTSLYAQAVRDFCAASGADYWTCYQAYQTAAARPEAVARPGAFCRAINLCSAQCAASLGVMACSTDGTAAGAIRPTAPPGGVCKSSANCTSAQTCDTSQCTVLSQCDRSTGFDIKSCGGTCVGKCELLGPSLAKLNRGTCQTSGDCTGEGETCAPVLGRTCRQSVCNATTGAVTTIACTGFCTSGSAPSLVSATLSGDGRQVALAFDQEVAVATSAPARFFAPATMATLGQSAQAYLAAEDPTSLVVYLGWGATVDVGDALTLAADPAISSRLTGRLATGGRAVVLQAPEVPEVPLALVSGPSSVGAGCAQGTAADVLIDASRTPFSAGRPVTFAWQVMAAASQRAALDELATAATDSSSPRLVVPGTTALALAAGTYTARLTVENWLGANATADVTFERVATLLPAVAIVGGSDQEFSVASGIRVQTAIDLATVCPGKHVTYSWVETSGVLPAGAFAANRATLAVKGPVAGVTGGTVLTFAFSATLEGAGTATASLALTARQARVMAVLAGPRGDVLDTRPLAFSGAGSLDPDDAANARAPFRFSWDCTATNRTSQLSTPCFTNPATAPDTTASQLAIPAGLLPADSSTYTLTLTVAKGSGAGTRTDSDTAVLRVLEGAAPTGTISRFCPGWSGCTSKLHTPSEPLRLVFALEDASLLPRTTFSWVSSDLSLATAAGTNRQALVVQPFTAGGAAVFADGAQATINVTATADGKNATASITVTMARRPSCTVGGGACLSVSPASGAVDNTSFVATASGFAADSTLLYDFGVQSAAGKQSFFVRSAADPRFTFAPRVLPEGASTMFVCAKDQAGAQACSTANVTVLPAAQQVTAADISALGSSLTTALSSGSTDAVLSVVRQLSAAASSQPTDAPPEDAAAASAAATEQAESAMGAMEDLLGADATVEESLGVADAASSLVGAIQDLSPQLADSGVNVAISVTDAISDPTSTATFTPDDLAAPVDIVGTCAAALVAEAQGDAPARRLLAADDNATLAEAALDALTRSFHIVSGVQSLLLSSMIAGESASVGGGTLVAAVGIADTTVLTAAARFDIGSTGASVTLREGFAELVRTEDTSLQVMLAHQADPSLLFAVISSTQAEVPSPTARRALLDTPTPEVIGAESTTLVTGYVNFTSSLDGIGTVGGAAVDITLPLNDAYDSNLPTMCLRLDSSGYWRSDAVSLTSVAGGAAHCALSSLNNQQVVAVQYVLAEGAAPASPSPGAGPGSPTPSTPSPSPPPAGDSTEVTVTVPQVAFTARLTAYTPSTFTLGVQQQFIAALQAASPGVDTLVLLTNIRAGSVVVDAIVRFLVSNGYSGAADQLAAALASDPSALLPPGAWGNVTVSDIAQSEVSITVPEGLLSAPTGGTSSNTTALIAGLVGGIGGAVLLAGVAICVWKLRKARSTTPSNQAEMMADAPESPMSPVSPASPTPFMQTSHAAPFAPSAPLA